MLARTEDSVLVVVDIQDRLANVMPAKGLSAMLRNTGVLLQAARLLDIPVLLTEQYPAGLGATHDEIKQHLPASTQTFEKTVFSATGAPGFTDALGATGRRQVMLAGMEAHVCVLQSSFALKDAGFTVFPVEDAITSRNLRNRRNAFARLWLSGISVTNTESVLFEWLGDAKHPHFKALAPLIR